MHVMTPAVAVIEEVVLGWLRELLGLPVNGSGAFVTGAQMANVTGLMAARHQVLEQAGWDVEVDGLFGAPPVTVVVGGERHAAVDRALRYLGFGTAGVVELAVDDQGALDPSDLARVLGEADGGPAIVCTQAGQREHGSLRSDRRGLHHRPRARGLGPRRRRLRPVGRGQQSAPSPARGLRGGRQLGRRHAQVAQRPLRLRGGAHRPPRGPPSGHGHVRRLPDAGRPPRADRLEPGDEPPGAGRAPPGPSCAPSAGTASRTWSSASAPSPDAPPISWAPPTGSRS